MIGARAGGELLAIRRLEAGEDRRPSQEVGHRLGRGRAGCKGSITIARRARGAGSRSRSGLARRPSTVRAASASAGARARSTRPTSRHPRPVANRQVAPNVQAWSKTVSAVRRDGAPMIAMTTATPSAAPTCRATEFIPVAVAKLSPGADATAAPLRFGNSVPAPIPSSTIPGSHSPTKSGVTATRSTNQSTAPPQIRPPATSTGRCPIRWARWLVGPATATATTGPIVSARPACRTL